MVTTRSTKWVGPLAPSVHGPTTRSYPAWPTFRTSQSHRSSGPAPRTSTPEQVPATMRYAQPLYPNPWLGGTWRLRDAVDYQETASISTLDWAAKYKENLLLNRYRSGRDQNARGKHPTPYA